MSRFWNTGICLMTLLMNGLISASNCTLTTALEDKSKPNTQTTGASITTSHSNLTCPAGTLPPNTRNCANHICPEDARYNASYPCILGYGGPQGICDDINECILGNHTCDANAKCKNTKGGYYCRCAVGFQKENQTEFCPSNVTAENSCADIDECTVSTGICGSNVTCSNTPGSYRCICKGGFINISNMCVEKKNCTRGLCGLRGICYNTNNTISCSCQQHYRAVSLPGFQFPQCNVRCKYRTSNEECTGDVFQCKMKNVTEKFKPFCKNVTSQHDLSLEQFLEDLDDLIDGFSYSSKTDRLQKAGILLTMLESTMQDLALLQQKAMSYVNKKKTTSILLTHGPPQDGLLTLQGLKSRITLDSKTAAGNTGAALLGCIEYTNITHILEEADLLEENSLNQSFQLVSPVISVFRGSSDTSSLQQPLSIRMNFTQEASRNLSCVFWSVSDNSWSSKGCVMVESDDQGVTCSCSHLTSFAVLMLLVEVEEIWTLSLITKIGLSISIFCLVLAIITFCFCRALHGTRNTIHTHLCLSLLIGNCIFLLGMEASHNKVLCGIVAGLLHAFYLCSFCWMALEGMELYRMLVTVFNTHLKKRYLLAVGYGTPAVIVIISAAIYPAGYGTKKYCWLSLEKGFIWAFMGPVCAIILVNCGIFVLTVWKLAEKMSSVSPDLGKLKRIRALTFTSLAQLCILGTCWVFGFFMFNSAKLFFIYAFTILNTLQGLQIFCLHCLMNKKVRTDYKKWLCALAHFKSPIYSEFSNTSHTHSQSKVKTGKESGF